MVAGGAGKGPDDELERAAQARREADGLRARLEAATRHADETTKRVLDARSRLQDEDADVVRLESMSWSRIAAALKGNRASDLERETAERDAARYAVAHAEERDEVARRDVQGIRAQLEQLGDVDRGFEVALAAKERSTTDPKLGRRLVEVAERKGVLLAEDQEAREAHAAGLVARQLLVDAHDLLGSARSWSTWDTFGGGGLLTDMMKYDKLDRVAQTLRQADHALGIFSRELADLQLGGVGGVQVDGLTRTFDVWFDNIFTDWAVRSRIQEAAARVGQALATVDATLGWLTERGRAYAVELAELDTRRQELLIG
jgi:hypothetical protein